MQRIRRAKALIRQQAEALDALAGQIDEAFDQAADMILRQSGKVVVTGMGKAGLIGAKIAATLCSTGQPAVFLDPAQALHGDMGMIGAFDILLALSNSGQTDEVLAVMRYCQARGVDIIAITGAGHSPIALEAKQAIVYPERPEGCPIDCAPMASTMMMLVIGDALAAALMLERKFSKADFVALHHGGYLGARLAVCA